MVVSSCVLYAVRNLLFVIWCLVSVVCCLLFVVRMVLIVCWSLVVVVRCVCVFDGRCLLVNVRCLLSVVC